MDVTQTSLPGVVIITPRVFSDERGFFEETWHRDRYAEAGLPTHFVQANHSRSSSGVLRGLHSQIKQPQGKLVGAITGTIWDVAVNVDPDSSHFKQWVGVELSEHNHQQLYIPPGFLHGFVVLSERADVLYKCTDLYAPGDELGVAWDDPELGIEWPIDKLKTQAPILSEADQNNPSLTAYLERAR